MMMKTLIWLSYDLGVRGDYEGIYAWLDEQGAKECGDSLAFINYEYAGDLLEALSADLGKAVAITKKTRIYVIYAEPESGKMKGKFIVGGRRAAPWTGFSGGMAAVDADEA